MTLFESLFLGSLQGITEFLPISSSGHLYLAEQFFHLVPNLGFEIFVHVGTLLAVVVFYWKEIWNYILNILKKNEVGDTGRKLIIATIITGVLGVLLNDYVRDMLSIQFVGVTLFCTALFILLAEKFRGTEKKFTWLIALSLGLVQAIAVIPGISRSGITIAFLIFLGLNRKKSAELSFLLSIPTILGALVFSLSDQTGDWFDPVMIFGFVAAALFGWLSIKWMIKLVEKNWIYFSVYCGLLGGVLLFL